MSTAISEIARALSRQRLSIPRLSGLERSMVEIRRRRFRAMELITILNRCHRFRGFVYQHAYFVRNFQRAFIALSAASR